ncbi:succinate dehydrogenase, hydrophobic membrane anchor protein [Shimia thalassica]|uniref:succinate dehydrogenase, hydrophobic membrane anchor protein n=1 Tax=Shimia thalassica TaxID=1715693 RepID=UPI001C0872E0|nr:succinate dehydrogenase, hydrophobic membrane anchor protein [Shimia thalassica]MBU2943696.1 succinate dehydrogenase, hydrophobic membrane anchor protein [Shimia thalassica]MDO6501767.1 succinate dehydrogenase, hydrophobic membrane anchor protein [Shimia thalassica]
MAFLTDRKRAEYRGSSRHGTEHLWGQTISAVGLAILVPLFILTFGSILGSTYEEAIAYYQRPFPAIIAGMTITLAMIHFRHGIQVVIEDYTRGLTKKFLIIACTCIAYAIAATGLFALARIAL